MNVSTPAWASTQPNAPELAPGHRIQTSGLVYLVELVAVVLRCAPTVPENASSLPDPAEITAAAKTTNDDVWALWNYIPKAVRAGTLFGPKERETFVDPATPLDQQGGCAGWRLSVRVQLGGFAPA